METAYYTFTAREIIVEGAQVAAAAGAPARQLVCVRRGGEPREDGSKVIDLAAWKSAREEEAQLERQWYDGVDEALEHPAAPQARPRRDRRRTVLIGGELLATLSVIGTMVILMLRIAM